MTPTIRTQDNRGETALRRFVYTVGGGNHAPEILVQYWTPPLRWRIARWWRRLTGQQ